MNVKSTILAAAATLGLAGAANAGVVYATSVTGVDGATQTTCVVQAMNSNRSDICNSLGAADGSTNGGFTSAGNFDYLIYRFGGSFTGPFSVFEISFGTNPNYVEKVGVMFALRGGGRVNFGTVANTSGSVAGPNTWEVVFGDNATGPFEELIVTDQSGTGDGFDIDAISANLSPVPVPAAGLMLLSALAGAAAFARRRKS